MNMRVLILTLLPLPAAAASECFHHYNHEAWDGDGLAIVMCVNTPDLQSCEIRHRGGARIQGLRKHGSRDKGREVFTDYNTTGAEIAATTIDIVCTSHQGHVLTFEIGNPDAWENGGCLNSSYIGSDCPDDSDPPDPPDPPACDIDFVDPNTGSPGNAAACDLLPANDFDTEKSLDVTECSDTTIDFHVVNVPAPAGLVYAQLSMRLHDADHPGEEGTVVINGNGPLSLPANGAWDDQDADATLPIPVSYLTAGTNVIEFGAGTRDRTVYSVRRVALTVHGEACAVGPIDPCDACDANATCIDDSCECNAGFFGDGETCTSVCSTCDANATCVGGGTTCECNPGYTGDGQSCVDVCYACDVNATCVGEGEERRCECIDGYTGDGFTCVAGSSSEECDGCDANATCIAGECRCNDGFVGDGHTCAPDCLCGDNATCQDGICVCAPGFLGDGTVCVDPCASCSTDATCDRDADGDVPCVCNPGFDGDGRTCRPSEMVGGCGSTAGHPPLAVGLGFLLLLAMWRRR